ncbi:hypothetical protein DID75_04990 [Candidatus Marinamargulisbacteria bacterium SCGC AG-410-N11]|nr:hypothetical protein DID75_04990 [Candidatus Marinamargulisbacteria bacterium SCGC AG-410-N11]
MKNIKVKDESYDLISENSSKIKSLLTQSFKLKQSLSHLQNNKSIISIEQVNDHYLAGSNKDLNQQKQIQGNYYYIQEEFDQNHVHFKIKKSNQVINLHKTTFQNGEGVDESHKIKKKLESIRISRDQEGCPCCVAGLDFDEFAAAMKTMLNNNHNQLASSQWVDFTSKQHWSIFFGISLPFALIGLTAAIRNIAGSWYNRKKINMVIKDIKEIIINIKREEAKQTVSVHKKQYNKLIKQLIAFQKTLTYSRFDSEFNFLIPGLVNGAASSMVLATSVWQQTFALPIIAVYSLGQVGRNIYDFIRVSNRSVFLKKKDKEASILNKKDRIQIGIQTVNQIGTSKRRFFIINTGNFFIFTIGAMMTFISSSFYAIRSDAINLPLGLFLLGYGALSTGIANNIWPNKFKPRNGDLGVSRLQLDQAKCLEEIGLRRELKKELKKVHGKIIQLSRIKRISCKILTALPFCNKLGQYLLHKHNQTRFRKIRKRLGEYRPVILNKLLNKKGITSECLIDLYKQWQICEKLGFDQDILNLLINDTKHSYSIDRNDHQCNDHRHCYGNSNDKKKLKHQSCCGFHKKNEFIQKIECMDIFNKLPNGTYKLKAISKIKPSIQKKLAEKIDFYLYFDLIEKLRYEERGLDDFYWKLEDL